MLPFSLNTFLLKGILAIFASLIIPLVYLISKEITGKRNISLLAALLSSFVPIEIQTNINHLSVYSLVLPLFLLALYLLMKIDKKRNFVFFMIVSLLLPLLHPASFMLVVAFFFYLVISMAESVEVTKLKKEAIVFCMVIVTLINFLIFKKGLMRDGILILARSIPKRVIEGSVLEFNILQNLYLLGILPIVLGVIGIYMGIMKKKNENIILLSSSLLGIIVLMMFRTLDISTGVLLLSPLIVIASSLALSEISDYLRVIRFQKVKNYFNWLFVLLVILLSVLPSTITVLASSKPAQEIEDLKWLKTVASENTTVISAPSQGNMIAGIANCRNVADNNYVLAPNLEERLNDIFYVYNTWSESKALQLLKKYDVNYLLLTEKAKQDYGITRIAYLENEKCFKKERETLYRIRC
jgi:4-amino-4-deoxy-L-arabinose transferase-like glycosyltransferase